MRDDTVNNETPESVYESYWKSLVEEDGVLNVDQVKKELFDFWQVMQLVPRVYCHVTGDQISKLLTDPEAVMNVADDHYAELHRERDPQYVTFNDLNVDRTVVSPGGSVSVDFSADGAVVGVEIL